MYFRSNMQKADGVAGLGRDFRVVKCIRAASGSAETSKTNRRPLMYRLRTISSGSGTVILSTRAPVRFAASSCATAASITVSKFIGDYLTQSESRERIFKNDAYVEDERR
jgi:hypothetical protein